MLLENVNHQDIKSLGQHLTYTYRDAYTSFEAASTQCVKELFETFRGEDDKPVFALIRIFRATHVEDLTPELRENVPEGVSRVLVLMGTAGLEPAWCRSDQSRSHRVIPVASSMSPMFKGVFRDLGIQWVENSDVDVPHGEMAGASMTRYFYVPEASEGGYITDQEEFVKPYGIRSVLAIGSQFLSDDAYVLIGFSRMHISIEQAKTLATLTPYVSTMLAIYDGAGKLWA